MLKTLSTAICRSLKKYSNPNKRIIMKEAIEKALSSYQELVELADKTFLQVQEKYPDEVRCHDGCISCCHAPFDLSVIEAIALQTAFKKYIPYGGLRSAIATAATEAEHFLLQEKKRYYKLSQEGHTQASILQEASKLQLRCPLLGPEDSCLLYDDRPITCRLYGIPSVIHSNVHVCGESGFEKNKAYPTVHMSKFQDKLSLISKKLQDDLKSSYRELYLVYIPLSSAILHSLDAAWLGVKK